MFELIDKEKKKKKFLLETVGGKEKEGSTRGSTAGKN